MSPESDGGSATVSIRPQYHVLGGAYRSALINRIHLTARTQPGLVVVADTMIDVQPGDATWSVGVNLRLPDGVSQANIVVTVELINIDAGQQSVEWSGVSAPVTVQSGGSGPAPASVPVFPGPPSNLTITSLTISPDSIVLMEGDSTPFVANVVGATGPALVIWSTLDPSVASVSATGRARGIRDGIARVVAQAGPRSDTVIARFTQRPATLAMSPDSVTFASIGQESPASVVVTDARGVTVASSAVTFTTRNPAIATVGSTGIIRSVGNGRTYVVATSVSAPLLRDSTLVTMTQRVASTVMTPSAVSLNAIGATAQLALTARDANGNDMDVTKEWSSDNAAIATVDAAGLVRATGVGVARITATAGGSSASSLVTVAQQPATVGVSPAEATMTFVHDTVRITAVVRDANGNAMPGAAPAWSSSNPAAATVDATGLVRAVGAGTATITAQSGTASGTARITVTQRVASLTVAPLALSAASLGQVMQVSASALDAGGAAVAGSPVTWESSNGAVATVSATGDVTTTGNGSAFIRALAGDIRDSIPITVRQVAVSIALDRSRDSLALGGTLRLTAAAVDALGRTIADAAASWRSSDATVAAVDATGLVTAVAVGNTVVTAQIDGVSASAQIGVYRNGPAFILVTPDSVSLDHLGATRQLTAHVQDRFGDPDPTPAAWTSLDTTIATVDAAGLVRAVAEGVTRVIAVAGIAMDTTPVVVHIPGTPNLTVRPISVIPGDTVSESGPSLLTLTVVNTGTRATVASKLHLRISVAPTYGELFADSTGVPPLAPGDSTVITRGFAIDTAIAYPDSVFLRLIADEAGLIDELDELDNVTMRAVFIRLNAARVDILDASATTVLDSLLFDALGDTVQLRALAYDRFGRVLHGRPITWSPVNPPGPPTIAVDSTGSVRPLSPGLAYARAGLGMRADSIPVRVAPVANALELSPDSLVMMPDDSAGILTQLRDRTGYALPPAPLTWTVSNPAVAIFDTATHRVHALTAGTTYVIGYVGTLRDSVLVRVDTPPPPLIPPGAPTITATWLGATRVWAEPSNWSPATVPGAGDTVFIPAAAPMDPELGAHTSIAGVVIAAGADLNLNGYNLTATGAVVAPGGITGGGLLVLAGNAPVSGVLPDVLISGVRRVTAQTVMASVSIVNGGNLIPASSLHVLDAFTWDSYGYFTMNDPAGDVRVDGNFYANRYDGNVPTLTAGTLRVRGDFVVGGNSGETFRAGGTHRVILDGTSPQALHTAYGGDGRHYFNDIEFANPDSVIITSPIYVANRAFISAGTVRSASIVHLVNGLSDPIGNRWHVATTRVIGATPQLPHLLSTHLEMRDAVTLQNDIILQGNVNLYNGALLDLGGRHLRVLGQFTLDSYGYLRMDHAADILDVAGDIYLNRHDGNVQTFSAGEIRVQGNFSTGGNSGEVFRATGTHRVVFNGTGRQNLSMAYGGDGRHHFNDVEFVNPDSVVLVTPVWVNSYAYVNAGIVTGATTAHIRSGVIDPVGNRWRVRDNRMFGPTVVIPTTIAGNLYFDTSVQLGGNVHVNGAVNLYNGANLKLNGHRLTVDGLFTLDSYGFLTMDNPADTLDVLQDIYLNRHDGNVMTLTAGEIIARRNFATGGNSGEVLRPGGTHKVRFAGTGLQAISLAYGHDGRHYFRNVEFANPDSVRISSDVWVEGDAVITAGKVVGPTTGHLRNGVIDTVGNRWRVATTHIMGLSAAVPTSIVGNVYFNSQVTLPQNFTLTGNVNINDGGDLILNGQTFRVNGLFTLNSYGYLRMANAADILDVSGDMYLNRHDGNVMNLSAGLIRLQGNFATGGNSGEVFRPSGSHRILFNGTSMQTVTLTYGHDGRHYFNDVEFANPDSVRFQSTGWVNGVATVSSGRVVGPHTVHVNSGLVDAVGDRWRVATTRFYGLTPLMPASLVSNLYFTTEVKLPNDVHVTGSVSIDDGAVLRLNGHRLRVTGNFTQNSYGFFRMNSATDVLDVGGNVYLNRHDGNIPDLSAGELRVQGDFATGGNSGEVFRPSGTHTVIFDGTSAQNVSMAYGHDGRHYFRNVRIRNPAGVTFSSNMTAYGNATVDASPAGSTWKIAAGISFDVVGDLRLHASSVLNNLGTLYYGSWPVNDGAITGNQPQPRGGS